MRTTNSEQSQLGFGDKADDHRKYGLQSLLAIEALSILTSTHHLDQLGISFLVPAVLIITLPLVTIWWFLRRPGQVARWTYALVVALIVVGFGLGDGLWNHTIKMIVFFLRCAKQTNMAGLPFPPVGSVFHEVTGVLSFVAAIIAIVCGYRFIAKTGNLPTGHVSRIAAAGRD